MSERLMRGHESLAPQAGNSFTLGLRPLLDSVWTASLGDTRAFDAVKRGLGAFYLSDYCHSAGTDGPDDASEPAASAALNAARAHLHGCVDFAVFASGAALEERARALKIHDRPLRVSMESFRASQLNRQLSDLDRISRWGAELRHASFGLTASTTVRLRQELQGPLSAE
ncbi:hypothetical protein [Streptomyces sp. NPDC060205]|uniref:hypothetical protein n=1 Tax=Streptomyces sp. NPDC060205 TaxID=3347072 RepID=UPI0036583253